MDSGIVSHFHPQKSYRLTAATQTPTMTVLIIHVGLLLLFDIRMPINFRKLRKQILNGIEAKPNKPTVFRTKNKTSSKVEDSFSSSVPQFPYFPINHVPNISSWIFAVYWKHFNYKTDSEDDDEMRSISLDFSSI